VIYAKSTYKDKNIGEDMPVEIKYIGHGYGVELNGTGIVTGEEIYEANKVIYSGGTPLKQKYQIADYDNAEHLDISHEDIVRLARQDIEVSKTSPNIIFAIVGEKDITFGLARMWEAYAFQSNFETKVFRNRKKAVSWIKKKLMSVA
jgi:hypothetical protein